MMKKAAKTHTHTFEYKSREGENHITIEMDFKETVQILDRIEQSELTAHQTTSE